MKIKDKAVELSPQEAEISGLADLLKAEGFSVKESSAFALSAVAKPESGFVQWLSLGMLALVDGIVETLPYGRP